MKLLSLLVPCFLFCFSNLASARLPPFNAVTISGTTPTAFNKVSLFESGGTELPFTTEMISDGKYSITISIPSDMKNRGDHFLTDMRFWNDTNENGFLDDSEPRSQCHFIIWVPSADLVYMQIYKGARHIFKSSAFQYNYTK